MTTLDAVVYGADELVAGPATDGRRLETYEDGAVAIVDGTVAAVGPTTEVTADTRRRAPTTLSTPTVRPSFRARRPPHPRAVRRRPLGRVRRQTAREVLSGHPRRRRRHPPTVRAVSDADEETLFERAVPSRRHARSRDDDSRGEVRLRARHGDRATDAPSHRQR